VLGSGRLPRISAGYAVVADWLDVDELAARVDEAAAAVAEGRLAAARAAATAALALARGPLLVDEEGEVITSIKGGMYQNPWVGIKTSAMDRLVRISAEFGMTPASRTKIKVETPTEEDLMATYLFGKSALVKK
jgi:hypothetical protein